MFRRRVPFSYCQSRENSAPPSASDGQIDLPTCGQWQINKYGGFLKWWCPQIIHFNGVFHYKPSILGYHYFWKPLHARILIANHVSRWWFQPIPLNTYNMSSAKQSALLVLHSRISTWPQLLWTQAEVSCCSLTFCNPFPLPKQYRPSTLNPKPKQHWRRWFNCSTLKCS